jgi:hypothetical protein
MKTEEVKGRRHEDTLEQPVAYFVPEWKGTPKAEITVAHLLSNTSGLADKRTTEDIYASGDFVKFAIGAELKTPPGKAFFYSNLSANLLPHVAKIPSPTSSTSEWRCCDRRPAVHRHRARASRGVALFQ